jgi:hypothetical protein
MDVINYERLPRRSMMSRYRSAVGWLILMLGCVVVGSFIYAPGSSRSHSKTTQRICAQHLRDIYQSLAAYRRDYGGAYPPDIADLITSGYINEPHMLICPASDDIRAPESMTRTAWADAVRKKVHTSYQMKVTSSSISGRSIIVVETECWHLKGGRPRLHVLYSDGRIECLTEDEVQSKIQR